MHCPRPFEQFYVERDGSVHLCCPHWIDVPAGNLLDSDPMKIWHGDVARSIRESILDQSFSHCQQCHLLPFPNACVAPSNPPTPDTSRISTLTIAYDSSCNLSCPSCRTRVRGRDPLSATIQSKLIDSDIFKHVDQLCTSGSGDPFASSLFWSLIDHLHSNDYPRLRLSIQSNGILLTEKNLVRLGAYNSRIDILSISIDGASPDTYAQNRRGGDWEVLMNNLANIVRRNIFIQLNMIVQQNNYREMPAFVRLARSFSANRVYLSALENWGTYDDADFQRRAVHLPNHPEHEDLLRVLDDDNLQDPNFITMGCLPKRTP